jgi:hypothetical protein
MGPRMHQLVATLCVTLFLALFALGGFDPTDGFCLRTLSYCRPTIIMWLNLDMVTISHEVEGALCEELGWRVNSCLLCPFITSVRARRFASLVVTP